MLLSLTLVTIAIVVLVLVVYLVLILRLLAETRRTVAAIADGLEAVQGHTRPLPQHLATINGGLSALLRELQGCDRHLGRMGQLLHLFQGR